MNEFLIEHWGNLSSIIGVVVSVVGLGWAVIEARRARSAAQAAEKATIEAKDNIGRHLLVIDLERAVSLIQRLKLLHSAGRWEAALEQYQALRAMTSAIVARYPEENLERRQRLDRARALISDMEDYVELQVSQGLGIYDRTELHRQLNALQSELENMANTIGFGD